MNTQTNQIEFTRINNDTNGNPRYVCHMLHFIAESEQNMDTSEKYKLAIKRANRIGGRKFHNKQYGGGIVFQSYNTDTTQKHIIELMQQFK